MSFGFNMLLYPIIQKGKYGYIRNDGSVAIQPQYQSAMAFSEGLAGIQLADKWGFIDLTGEVLIKPRFDSCNSFAHGLAVVNVGNSKQYIDKAGNVVVRTDYYRCDSFEGELAPVFPDIRSKGAFINRTGTIVLSGRNFLISHLSHGLINCPEKGKWGFINIQGEFKIAPKYQSAYPFREGLAAVAPRHEDKYCFIDTDGRVVIAGAFEGADIQFSEDLCAVWKNHFGYIDRTGKVVIPYRFDFADHFSEGLAVVKESEDGPYGYIDSVGKMVISPAFTHADAFAGDLAEVIVGEQFDSYHYGYINRAGKYVWKPTR